MKKRTGFVSNSSTTSFCIYGVCLDKDEYKKLSQEILNKIRENGLHEEWGQYDNVYVGNDFPQEYETPPQWRERITKALNEIFPGQEIQWYEEAYYAG